jgi:hypothetical protein
MKNISQLLPGGNHRQLLKKQTKVFQGNDHHFEKGNINLFFQVTTGALEFRRKKHSDCQAKRL